MTGKEEETKMEKVTTVPKLEKAPCAWSEDSDGVWETLCGGAFVFDTGGPTDNKAKFCLYCGGEIVVIESEEELDAALARAGAGGGT